MALRLLTTLVRIYLTQRFETRSAMTRKDQRQNNLATFLAYLKFRRLDSTYFDCMANQMQIFRWIDERRIEMLAEGRPHWVPSLDDFDRAVRDCWDDLVKL